MYYIIRYGTDRGPLKQIELPDNDKAPKRWERLNHILSWEFDVGLIRRYTCLLITKGERVNETKEK